MPFNKNGLTTECEYPSHGAEEKPFEFSMKQKNKPIFYYLDQSRVV